MKTISKNANLSQEYTNHSIGATAVTLLDHSNFEARHIMRVSAHKSDVLLGHTLEDSWRVNRSSEISDALSAAFLCRTLSVSGKRNSLFPMGPVLKCLLSQFT